MELQTKPRPPRNYLGAAIFSLIFFWPLGIPSLVNALRVDKYWFAGYHEEAEIASRRARRWANSVLIFYLVLFGFVWFYINSYY